jgi:predicted secreted hydrolase
MLFVSLLVLASRAVAQTPFVPVLDEQGFVRATSGRALKLPADHASHPETRTEWWYLTGELHAAGGNGPDRAGDPRGADVAHAPSSPAAPSDAGGADFGFQATWFRRALIAELPADRSPLATRDVMLYHGALTDVAAGALSFHEQSCRAYPPWAHAAVGALDVALFDSTLRALDEATSPHVGEPASAAAPRIDPSVSADVAAAGPSGRTHLHCHVGDGELDAELELSACAPLLHGEEPGLSRKGDQPGQASWYYSLPRVPLHGTLHRPGRADLAVEGRAWFDHEFGSSQLAQTQVGWDWFSVALDDGSDLMLYRMRRDDGSADTTSSGTFRGAAAGAGTYLPRDAFSLAATGTWTSPRTGARYPAGWTIEVPAQGLVLRVTPAVADQELVTPGSTGVTYWEGLCRFSGTRAGRPVSGEGYVELVGYAARFTERL